MMGVNVALEMLAVGVGDLRSREKHLREASHFRNRSIDNLPGRTMPWLIGAG